MIFAESNFGNVQIMGAELGGAAAIQSLQQALQALSMAAAWGAANPGNVDGQISQQTINAVTAVVANLGGKIDSSVKSAIQLAAAAAQFNSDARAVLSSAISQYASQITIGVKALTAVYTKASAPPTPPPPPAAPLPPLLFMQRSVPVTTAGSKSLPPGSVQAQTKAGTYRVAIPVSQASAFAGVDLGAATLFEIQPRQAFTPGTTLVTEKDLEEGTEPSKPFWKNPIYWAAVGGVAVVGGGAYYMMRRRG